MVREGRDEEGEESIGGTLDAPSWRREGETSTQNAGQTHFKFIYCMNEFFLLFNSIDILSLLLPPFRYKVIVFIS